MARAILKPRHAKPFIYHHPWVFSGAVARVEGSCANGDVVDVVGDRGDFIGRGLYNTRSQIAVRLCSWRADEQIDEAFFRRKIASAIALRNQFVPITPDQTARRIVFSEGDGLPGLIVDQYAGWLVVQFLSFGLDLCCKMILDALEQELKPDGIYERSDADVREKEGMSSRKGLLRGAEPPDKIEIRDGGIAFAINVRSGQKTGHYLDQRENRRAAAKFAPGRRVLDAFCYSGGFGIAAAMNGAESVVCVDSSEPALELVRENAALNGCGLREPPASAVGAALSGRPTEGRHTGLPPQGRSGISLSKGDKIELVRENASAFLSGQASRSFDMVVLDPPGFAKSSYRVDNAVRSYCELYAASMRLLEPGGVLVACCCSQHISAADVLGALNAAAVETGRSVQVIESRGQPPDHPVAANCPETAYLKCLICRVDM